MDFLGTGLPSLDLEQLEEQLEAMYLRAEHLAHDVCTRLEELNIDPEFRQRYSCSSLGDHVELMPSIHDHTLVYHATHDGVSYDIVVSRHVLEGTKTFDQWIEDILLQWQSWKQRNAERARLQETLEEIERKLETRTLIRELEDADRTVGADPSRC